MGLAGYGAAGVSRGIQRYFVDNPTTHWSWLDKEIFKGEQTVKLSYNVLTRRYRISRGALFQNFASLEEALNILSRQSSAIIPAELMKKDGNYMAAARLRLDISAVAQAAAGERADRQGLGLSIPPGIAG